MPYLWCPRAVFSIIILSVLNIEIHIFIFVSTAVLSALFSIWLLKRLKQLMRQTPVQFGD